MLVVVGLLLGVATVFGQGTWQGDKSHSMVKFSVVHMLVSEVEGRFRDFEVTLVQPGKEDFTGSTVEATIKTASVTTENDDRDNHLRGDDFFNSEKFPDMKFKSTKFEKTGKDTYKITGNLTIRDITKPVVLDAKMTGMLESRRGTIVGFRATTTIDRFEFGTKWNRTLEGGGLIVSKEVNITLLFEFHKINPEAINPK